jgi:hypothetical protein
MKIEKGNILFFHYRKYHKDRNPLAVVLYADDKLVHCINLHALTPSLTDELIELIAKIVGRIIDGRDTYTLYHNLFKRKLPYVLKYAYRTYKPEFIQSAVFVSKGFETNILYQLRGKYTPEKVKRTQDRIKKEISVTVNKEPDELLKAPPREHRFKSIEDYIEQIKKIAPPKIDIRKYTGIRRKK